MRTTYHHDTPYNDFVTVKFAYTVYFLSIYTYSFWFVDATATALTASIYLCLSKSPITCWNENESQNGFFDCSIRIVINMQFFPPAAVQWETRDILHMSNEYIIDIGTHIDQRQISLARS